MLSPYHEQIITNTLHCFKSQFSRAYTQEGIYKCTNALLITGEACATEKKKVIKLKEGLKINKSAIFKRNARHQYFVTRISSVEYYS